MRETTIRRTLIVALCIFGVVALWVIADRAADRPETAVSTPPRSGGSGVISPASRTSHRNPSARPTSTPGTGVQPGSGTAGEPTATETAEADRTAPPVVPGVHIISTTYQTITIGWDAVQDHNGLAYYRVTLNGIKAGETGGGQLTIDWFNDGMSTHFVQVWAFDNAGNRSPRSVAVMVSRPAPPGSTRAPGPQPDPGVGHPQNSEPGKKSGSGKKSEKESGTGQQSNSSKSSDPGKHSGQKPDGRKQPPTEKRPPAERPQTTIPVPPSQTPSATSLPEQSATPSPPADPRSTTPTPTPEPSPTETPSPSQSPTEPATPPTTEAPSDEPTDGEKLGPGDSPTPHPSASKSSAKSAPAADPSRLESSTASSSPSASPTR